MSRAQEVQTSSSEQQPIAIRSESTSSTEARKKPGPGGKIEAETSVEASQNWLLNAGHDFVSDQKEIWTSPAKLRLSDSEWLLPIGGVMAGLFVTDAGFNRSLSTSPTTISRNKTFSNAGVAALAGSAGAMWVMGRVSHNPHWRETGY